MTRPSRRRFLRGSLAVAGVGLLAGCGALPAGIAPAARVPRIGYLHGATLSVAAHRIEAFRQGLRELGYEEGRTIVIEWRSWEGDLDRQGALAAEIVRLEVDIIVAAGGGDTRAAREATATIPIVMVNGGDPLGSGFVASLAHPGGNVTGLASLRPEISGKRLELLKGIVPTLSRVAAFVSSPSADYAQVIRELDLAAGSLGVELRYLDIRTAQDVEGAFQAAARDRADAVIVRLPGPLTSSQRPRVAELAVRSRLPVIHEVAEDVEAGGLMAYGVSVADQHRRAADYVDKILKGAKPADLPVQQPTKFDLIINLKTARALGLTIPESVLQQATELIQ